MTADRTESADPPTGFHAPKQVGRTRHMTPEGFLLCRDVAVARTGWMIYAPGEVPVEPGPDGYVMVTRDADALFSPVALASFAGKSLTNDHPAAGVNSDNWGSVTVGTVHNPRRGTGTDSDVMLADLLVTDAAAIRDVLAGKVEVSAGYEASYKRTGVGQARQLDIIGNHIALVRRGRCGPRCSIGDHAPQPQRGKKAMGKNRIQVADKDNENDDYDFLAAGENQVHVHLHGAGSQQGEGAKTADAATADARITALETGVADVLKAVQALTDTVGKKIVADAGTAATADADVTDAEGTGKPADSKALETGFRAVMADAEVLLPGFSMPTFDSAAKRAATVDSMCQTRRRVLDAVAATAAGKALVEGVAGASFSVATADCAAVAVAFRAAAGAKRLLNNRGTVGDQMGLAGQAPKRPAGPTSIAELNAMNRKMFPLPTAQA